MPWSARRTNTVLENQSRGRPRQLQVNGGRRRREEAEPGGILRLRPLLMSRGRWCNPPQVTRNDTIAGNDDHLSAPFRRAQRLVLPGACTTAGPLPITTRPRTWGSCCPGWGEELRNAHSPIRDNRSEAYWPRPLSPLSFSAASLQVCAARVLISCAFPCRGHDALAGCVWVAMGFGPEVSRVDPSWEKGGAKGRGKNRRGKCKNMQRHAPSRIQKIKEKSRLTCDGELIA